MFCWLLKLATRGKIETENFFQRVVSVLLSSQPYIGSSQIFKGPKLEPNEAGILHYSFQSHFERFNRFTCLPVGIFSETNGK